GCLKCIKWLRELAYFALDEDWQEVVQHAFERLIGGFIGSPFRQSAGRKLRLQRVKLPPAGVDFRDVLALGPRLRNRLMMVSAFLLPHCQTLKLSGDVAELAVEVLASGVGCQWRSCGDARLRFGLLKNDAVEPFSQGDSRLSGRQLGGLTGILANPFDAPRNSRLHARACFNCLYGRLSLQQ